MATTRLPPDFKEFLQLLETHRVRYLLVGGHAVAYHGYPRATVDMFGFDTPNLSADLFLKEDQIVRMGVPPVRLEIFTAIPGVRFEECYQERVVDVLDGVSVSLIRMEDLKTNKRASGRHKDLNDLENLP